MTNTTIEQSIIDTAIDAFKNGQCLDVLASEVHHEIFNADYFIIGHYQAEKWLSEECGIFNAIEIIKTYEQDNFGEVSTDLSSAEKVVNMYAYIQGENLLGQITELQNNWENNLDQETIDLIIEELEGM